MTFCVNVIMYLLFLWVLSSVVVIAKKVISCTWKFGKSDSSKGGKITPLIFVRVVRRALLKYPHFVMLLNKLCSGRKGADLLNLALTILLLSLVPRLVIHVAAQKFVVCTTADADFDRCILLDRTGHFIFP